IQHHAAACPPGALQSPIGRLARRRRTQRRAVGDEHAARCDVTQIFGGGVQSRVDGVASIEYLWKAIRGRYLGQTERWQVAWCVFPLVSILFFRLQEMNQVLAQAVVAQ